MNEIYLHFRSWWLRSPLLWESNNGEGAKAGPKEGDDNTGVSYEYEFEQKPGELLFFCPGWWHSTYVEEEDDPLVCSIPLAL